MNLVESAKHKLTAAEWEAVAAHFGTTDAWESTEEAPLPRAHDLSSAILEARWIARMTRKQLAEAAGISYPYMAEIDKGKKTPSIAVLIRLEEVLGVPLRDYLPTQKRA